MLNQIPTFEQINTLKKSEWTATKKGNYYINHYNLNNGVPFGCPNPTSAGIKCAKCGDIVKHGEPVFIMRIGKFKTGTTYRCEKHLFKARASKNVAKATKVTKKTTKRKPVTTRKASNPELKAVLAQLAKLIQTL